MSRSNTPTFVFDLDGTLLDNVYQHVIAWQRAFGEVGLDLAVWRIHRRVGMSGSMLAPRVSHESGHDLTADEQSQAEKLHGRYYQESLPAVQPLPGARELLGALDENDVDWAIATSGKPEEAQAHLAKLDLPREPTVVTSADVDTAKPDPAIFLSAAARLGADAANTVVVGDAIWDMLAARRGGMLGIGVLSGGYSQEELERAQAFRVYLDVADLHAHLDELGIILG